MTFHVRAGAVAATTSAQHTFGGIERAEVVIYQFFEHRVRLQVAIAVRKLPRSFLAGLAKGEACFPAYIIVWRAWIQNEGAEGTNGESSFVDGCFINPKIG